MSATGGLHWRSCSYPWRRRRGRRDRPPPIRPPPRRSNATPPAAWRMGASTPATMPFVGIPVIQHFSLRLRMRSFTRIARRRHCGTIAAPLSWRPLWPVSTVKSVRPKRDCIPCDPRLQLDTRLSRRRARPWTSSIRMLLRWRNRIDRLRAAPHSARAAKPAVSACVQLPESACVQLPESACVQLPGSDTLYCKVNFLR
jgi:hypothetical protein